MTKRKINAVTLVLTFILATFGLILNSQSAQAATCPAVNITTPELWIVNDTTGMSSSGTISKSTRKKEYAYVGQTAEWRYSISGTGIYSATTIDLKTSVPTSSAGTKTLNKTQTFSMTSNDGVSSCTGSVVFKSTANVIKASPVEITFTGGSYNFNTEKIRVSFTVDTTSTLGDIPFGYLNVTLNDGYSVSSGADLVNVVNGKAYFTLDYNGTAVEKANFKDRAFNTGTCEPNQSFTSGYCYSSPSSWWQGSNGFVSKSKLRKYMGQNFFDPIKFTTGDPLKFTSLSLSGDATVNFRFSVKAPASTSDAAMYNVGVNNLALSKTSPLPSGVSVAGTAANSGTPSYLCLILSNCSGKAGSVWTTAEQNKVKACYEGDTETTLASCIKSITVPGSVFDPYGGILLGVPDWEWSFQYWVTSGLGQKAFFVPSYSGYKMETAVGSYQGPVLQAIKPGTVKICESESTGVNWNWYDYGQTVYNDGKYELMRKHDPAYVYNLAQPYYHYSGVESSLGQTGLLGDFTLSNSIPTTSNDRWDIGYPSLVNSSVGANYFGGSAGNSVNMGRSWTSGLNVWCLYPSTKTQPKISFKLKLPTDLDGTVYKNRVYKDTMPLTIQELSVTLGTKKMYAPNIVFKIYKNAGTYASPKKGTPISTISGTKDELIAQVKTQCHKLGGNLKKNMCKDFSTAGVLNLPVDPVTGKSEYVIEAYWGGDCDSNVPGLKRAITYATLTDKTDFGKCGIGSNYARGSSYFAYNAAVSPLISFTVVKEFQCLFENGDGNFDGTPDGTKNIWVTYKDVNGTDITVNGQEVYKQYNYTKLDGTTGIVKSTFTTAQRSTLANGGIVTKNGHRYKLDINGNLAVIIVRSGDTLTLTYPSVKTTDYVGIIDTAGVTQKIKTQTYIKDGSTPWQIAELDLYPYGNKTSYGRTGLYFNNLVELVGKVVPSFKDWVSFFWPSTQNPVSEKRGSVTLVEDIWVYGWAYTANSNSPKLDWHQCQDAPETEAITVISSQVSQ